MTLHADAVKDPLRWRKARVVFVNSMSDLFHRDVPESFILRVFQAMEQASWHVFQVLTKRSDRLREPVDRLHFAESACDLSIGSNVCRMRELEEKSSLTAVAIDRTPLLKCAREQNGLFLTLQVFDDERRRVIWIDESELLYSTYPWDIEFVGRVLTVRHAPRDLLLEVEFMAPNRVDVRRGVFSHNGLELLVQPDLCCYFNSCNVFWGLTVEGCNVAIAIGDSSRGILE